MDMMKDLFVCLEKPPCAYLEQIPQYDDGIKVIDVLKLAFEEVYRIENKMRELEEKMKFLED